VEGFAAWPFLHFSAALHEGVVAFVA
jgi:hypothetical protein